MPSIADLLAQGRLERVEPQEEEAGDLIRHANAHLDSARTVVDADAAGAYQLAYDAARKAVVAHMVANGYRAKSDRPGAHAALVAYAEEALDEVADAASLAQLDRMRRLRNRSEYGGISLGRSQVEADIEHAAEIVRSVAGESGRSLG